MVVLIPPIAVLGGLTLIVWIIMIVDGGRQ